MKDPLQTEQTYYEILGVSKGASRTEIDAALVRVVNNPKLRVKAQEAQQALVSNRVDRAWYDLREYDEKILGQLVPSPLDDPTLLDPSVRALTLQEWEGRLKRDRSNLGLVHSLAVSWYWWTKHEEERFIAILKEATKDSMLPKGDFTKKSVLLQHITQKGGNHCNPKNCSITDCLWRSDCLSSAPPLIEMWERVIAYWAMLVSIPTFWDGAFDLAESNSNALKKKLEHELKEDILGLSDSYNKVLAPMSVENVEDIQKMLEIMWEAGVTAEMLDKTELKSLQDVVENGTTKITGMANINDNKAEQIVEAAQNALDAKLVLPSQYRNLEIRLLAELESAELLRKVGVETSQGKISCGVLMLTNMGMLDTVRSAVDASLTQRPKSHRLQRLRGMLSPYSAALILIENKKPEKALEAIEKLPINERQSVDVRDLQARALSLLAKNQIDLHQQEARDAALDTWSKALQTAGSKERNSKIHTEIVSACHAKAVSMPESRREEAITLLEKATDLVQDKKLNLTLADLLTRRGFEIFKGAQKRTEREKQGITPEIMQAFETGLTDLERAEELGYNEAAKQADVARKVIKQARAEIFTRRGVETFLKAQTKWKRRGITRKIIKALKTGLADLKQAEELGCEEAAKQADVARKVIEHAKSEFVMKQANQAVENKNWDKAIEYFERSIQMLGNDTSTGIKQSLGTCLFNRGIDKIERGIKMINEGYKTPEEVLISLIKV